MPKNELPSILIEEINKTARMVVTLNKQVQALEHLAAKYKPATAVTAVHFLTVIEPLWKAIETTQKIMGLRTNIIRIGTIPEAFSAEGVKTISVELKQGLYRATVNQLWRASIKEGQKDPAHSWLRKAKAGDLIVPTVNAQTLSAYARTYNEDKGMDLPDDLFKVTLQPSTSLTKVK